MNTKKLSIKKMSAFDRMLLLRRYGITVVLFLLIGLMLLLSPTFRKMSNFISIMLQVSINGMLALGQTFVMTTGGTDMSVGSIMALVGVLCGVLMKAHAPFILVLILPLIVATFVGVINGYVITKYHFFPFVVTLATQLTVRGAAYIISNGHETPITNANFLKIASYKIGGWLPIPVLIFIFFTIIAYFLLQHTVFGRYVYASGGNPDSAYASGINVLGTNVGAYAISGFLAGIAGIIFASRVISCMPNGAIGYDSDAIAAAVIGGASFSGGISTIPGTVVGVMILGIIYNGMNLLGINTYWQYISKGLLILGSVALDKYLNKRK